MLVKFPNPLASGSWGTWLGRCSPSPSSAWSSPLHRGSGQLHHHWPRQRHPRPLRAQPPTSKPHYIDTSPNPNTNIKHSSQIYKSSPAPACHLHQMQRYWQDHPRWRRSQAGIIDFVQTNKPTLWSIWSLNGNWKYSWFKSHLFSFLSYNGQSPESFDNTRIEFAKGQRGETKKQTNPMFLKHAIKSLSGDLKPVFEETQLRSKKAQNMRIMRIFWDSSNYVKHQM